MRIHAAEATETIVAEFLSAAGAGHATAEHARSLAEYESARTKPLSGKSKEVQSIAAAKTTGYEKSC